MKNQMIKVFSLSIFCLFLAACGGQLTKVQQMEYNYYISLKFHEEMNHLDEELLSRKIDQKEYDIKARSISRYYSARYYNAPHNINDGLDPYTDFYAEASKQDSVARKTYVLEDDEPEATNAVSRSIKSRSYMSF